MAQYRTIGRGEAGKPYGHVPGHTYDDVHVAIAIVATGHGPRYRIVATKVWGSAQGRDEEHGRERVVVTGAPSIQSAVSEIRHRASAAEIPVKYLMAALSEAEGDAEDSIERDVAYS